MQLRPVAYACLLFVLVVCAPVTAQHKYPRRTGKKDFGRLGWELLGPYTEKKCGDCTFAVNNVTLVLERLPGCNPLSCTGTLNLSATSPASNLDGTMAFLGIGQDIFQGMTDLEEIDLSGHPIQNIPFSTFQDQVFETGVTVNLKGTLLTCTPPNPPPHGAPIYGWNGLPAINYVMNDDVSPDNVCKWVKKCGSGEHICDFWINDEGLASMGGECRSHCLELDLIGTGVTQLPTIPNGLIDAIHHLVVLKLDAVVHLIPSRQFSLPNLMWTKKFIVKTDAKSWAFAGKAWFTVPMYPDMASLGSLNGA
mmetsp:Transcript_42773/g.83675  ORF Transcript_42773/g.83675 Transcript_42773/m.83675 type:complete len:308 (-) Transcript_42773:42-965(-)|eukprot:CAMPEP_0173384062 /NCGR_PEP_ID=MMETSP1356-20130122/6629_1 /TAXON_ID=77927 ORGANISM="Hemiselmis virescens, Strain PCC157" /NCGR_SAMPLE_ID=MMETSP1356 /ASSEMBLY_ACC=CAM_ASM_000847 /LENGTH=307 /DNA_ID=CAMNT_0014339231 /DNA_START=60 /DNA_END=983 /DNA_ORIENTATION=-